MEFAHHVIVFTTFLEPAFTASEVLQWYRTRWRIELVFKRFRSPAQLGHLLKYNDESAKAWLYGKLPVTLLVEKPACYAVAVSPGDTTWRRRRPPVPWRDFGFVLNQVARTIEPHLPLTRVIHQWYPISRTLAEPPRRRPSQLAAFLTTVN